MPIDERARVGVEFDVEEGQRDFRAAMLDLRVLVGELADRAQDIDFDPASASAVRLRGEVANVAREVSGLARSSASELGLTEDQADELARSIRQVEENASRLGGATVSSTAEMRRALDQTQVSAQRLNDTLAGAQARGGAGTGAAGGAASATGRLSRIVSGLGAVARAAGAAGAAVGAFLGGWRLGRQMVAQLKEVSNGLIDIDRGVQALWTRVLGLSDAADGTVSQTERLRVGIEALNRAGVEHDGTWKSVNAGLEALAERQEGAAVAADKHREFLRELTEEASGLKFDGLNNQLERLVTNYETARESGDNLLDGPLGDTFKEQVLEIGQALDQFGDTIERTLTGEQLERFRSLRATFADLHNEVDVMSTDFSELEKASGDTLDTLEKDGPKATKAVGDLADETKRAREEAQAWLEATRERVRITEEAARASQQQVDSLKDEADALREIDEASRQQGVSLQDYNRAADARSELFKVQQELNDAEKEAARLARDHEAALDDQARATEATRRGLEDKGKALDKLSEQERKLSENDALTESLERQETTAKKTAQALELVAAGTEALVDGPLLRVEESIDRINAKLDECTSKLGGLAQSAGEG